MPDTAEGEQLPVHKEPHQATPYGTSKVWAEAKKERNPLYEKYPMVYHARHTRWSVHSSWRTTDDIVKLDTAEARVRGRGHVVVRREEKSTQVSVWQGEVRVSTRRGTAQLEAGFGCRVEARGPCRPAALPAAPTAPRPGSDPTYVVAGQPLTLAWSGDAPAFHVQVLSFDEEAVLAQREVSRPSLDIAVPWPGLYRFRASARGADGLESRPSFEGLFQVMPARWMKSGTGDGGR